MATKEVSSMATKLAVDPLAAEIPTDEHRRRLVQIKVSGLMCSFCTMSVEEALRRRPDVNSVLVNMVHRTSSWSRPTCPRSAGRSLLQDLVLIRRCHYEYRDDR
jgi:hypothetical protein